ncbi:MAG: Fic family protein [Verrucomicrobia bacterium]|nr:Fic family protein [Verrucomicrobiota bacterium]MDA1005060.1 Fic family protein [Verrucomicrobiota bacterium]
MPPRYTPPYTITSSILSSVAEIGAEIGRLTARQETRTAPLLRRQNRIRSIHASLAIENNTLSLDQVTAIISGKRVLGPPREIQEVKNAYAAYEALPSWNPASSKDLLAAHRLMLHGLAEDAGKFRRGSVGIAKGKQLVHLAPPASRVPALIKDLLGWLKHTDAHPLIAGCVFHYELEFIHPFTDGNGRVGRLWQTLILSRWHPIFTFLPVEAVIRDQQASYYKVLAACDKSGNSTAFAEFLLAALLLVLRNSAGTDQVSDQVSDQVKALLHTLRRDTLSALECMKRLKLAHRPTFRKNYLSPALSSGLIEYTIPEKPQSRLQRYRLTSQGHALLSIPKS